MILCLPFLMFQGRAQEAIDHYLNTFPEAELLEILHHPAGTEIYDPQTPNSASIPVSETTDELASDTEKEHRAETSSNASSVDTAPNQASIHQTFAHPDTAAVETVVDSQMKLVATAQLRIGGQVLMIQDSLAKHAFDFTPSTSIAVVVDTEAEFTQITDQLAKGGSYLMEPGSYDFAQNFTWVQDKFGISWQINQPRDSPEPGSDVARDVAQAKAPEWG